MLSPDPLAETVLDVLPLVMRVVRRQIHRTSKSRLTPPQFRILKQIQDGSDQIGRLAAEHGIAQPSMSKLVEGLVRRGWVKKIRSERDRRKFTLSLTTQGRRLLARVQSDVLGQIAQRLAGLSSEKREALRSGLEQLVDSFI